MPVAVTEKVADSPAVTLRRAAYLVIEGAVTGSLTVRVAGLLVTLPAALLATTVNCAPSSAVVVGGVV